MAQTRVNKLKFFKTRLGPKGRLYYFLTQDGSIKCVSRPGAPFQVEIFPSLRCNVNCLHCDRGSEKSALKDFNDIKILYDNLRKDAVFNVVNFRVSGGEPTIYPGINKLILFLRNLNPHSNIDFFTNGIELEKIAKRHLGKLNLAVSIYPYTVRLLEKDKYIADILKKKGIELKVNISHHEDMKAYGTIKNKNFNPVSECLKATLLCGTKKVYPCCRAHILEQMYKKNYHYRITGHNLYNKLKNLIEKTNLCSHCPRTYKNPAEVLI